MLKVSPHGVRGKMKISVHLLRRPWLEGWRQNSHLGRYFEGSASTTNLEVKNDLQSNLWPLREPIRQTDIDSICPTTKDQVF